MEIRVLGPLTVTVSGQTLPLPSARQRTVLAMLLVERGHVVPVHRLIDALWDDDPPPTARAQVQICISALRRSLNEPGGPGPIQTVNGGYLLSVDEASIDLAAFSQLVATAETEATQHPERAVERLRTALGLWRGEAFADIDSRLVGSAARRLGEVRLAAAERCVELEIAMGRYEEAITRLTGLIRDHPLREPLRYQQMLALYRSGLRAEALAVFRDTREVLVAELGLEPGAELRALEHTVLVADDHDTGSPAGPGAMTPVPRQLPPDVPNFTGRAESLALVRRALEPMDPAARRSDARVVVVSGRAGVGKTALAVRLAHDIAGSFPDGQLFVALRGEDPQPLGAAGVLGRFLRALGVPGTAIADGVDERAETFRSLVADKRLLIVLDAAASEAQVRSLLPGNGTAAVLVTSRRRLSGLAGATHCEVDILDRTNSVRLLAAHSGRELRGTELAAAQRLAEQCGGLPLAICIAAARLAGRPHWSVAVLAERLADGQRQLDELRHGDLGVRSSIALTYDTLPPPVRRLFRLLALLGAADFGAWVVGPLLDSRVPGHGADLLELLVDARLVDAVTIRDGTGEEPRYRLHDLLRVYARERLGAEEPATERAAAFARLAGCLVHLAAEAHRRHYGGDYTLLRGSAAGWSLDPSVAGDLLADPLRWFERERATIVATVDQAAEAGLHEHAWELAISTVALFEQGAYFDDWRETHERAWAAARTHGDRRGEAAMSYSLGALSVAEQRPDEAVGHLRTALRLFDELGLAHGTALTLRHLAFFDRLQGRHADAVARYEQALPVLRSVGDRIGEAHVLHGLGRARLDRREYAAARTVLADALTICREAGNRRVAAQATHALAEIDLDEGDVDSAERQFRTVLWAVRNLGDRIGEAYAMEGLGLALLRRGQPRDAIQMLAGGRDVARRATEPMVEARLQLAIGEAYLADSRPTLAIGVLTEAFATFRRLRAVRWQERALRLVGAAHRDSGDEAAARVALAECAALSAPDPAG